MTAVGSDPWNPSDEPVSIDPAGGAVTVVDGTTFCVSERDGSIAVGAQGLFFADVRALSRLRLEVDGVPPEPLAATTIGADRATFVLRTRRALARPNTRLVVIRRRQLADVMVETIELRNYGSERQAVQVV